MTRILKLAAASAVVWLRLYRGAASPGAVAGAGTDASAGDVAPPSAAALLQCQVLWQGGNIHEAKQHFSLDIVAMRND